MSTLMADSGHDLTPIEDGATLEVTDAIVAG